eukprot:TRINITY_DN2162_c0_g1_i1.p2 TRINITY_DN2162_c0_g1~~TRINITY_DN2162_c0_g1_i1.p2  ORF type:complete len:135 (-),score=17.76 TRINITY_DN2162_c0_g1_i1:101-457(-)
MNFQHIQAIVMVVSSLWMVYDPLTAANSYLIPGPRPVHLLTCVQFKGMTTVFAGMLLYVLANTFEGNRTASKQFGVAMAVFQTAYFALAWSLRAHIQLPGMIAWTIIGYVSSYVAYSR